jgi:hypothetical protein
MHKAAKAAAKATAPSHWRRFKAKSSRIRGLFIHRLDASILVIPIGMKYVNFGIMDKWDQAALAEDRRQEGPAGLGQGPVAPPFKPVSTSALHPAIPFVVDCFFLQKLRN